MNRAAYVAAFLAGWLGYHAAKFVIRNLDIASWRSAWERVPAAKREAFRNTLLAEEGVVVPDGD